MSEAEFWEWVAREIRAERLEEGRRTVVELLEREVRNAERFKWRFLSEGNTESFNYWEGFEDGVRLALNLLRKFGVV